MDDFSNLVILPENIPSVKQENFNALHKNYMKILLIRIIIFALSLITGLLLFLFFSEKKVPGFVLIPVISVVSAVIIFSVIITVLGFARKGYLVREKDISYQKGLITYVLTSVPYNRIQHVEVNQGVLGKLFHLSAIKIYTAGGTSSDLSIPGLPVEDAQKLKAFLSEKISEHE